MTIEKDEAETIPVVDSEQLMAKITSSRPLCRMIITILFIIGGLLFLARILQGTQVLSIILAPVAIILIFFTIVTKPTRNNKDLYNTLAFSLWIIVSYVITIQADSEVLFILILIGFLIIQELFQELITQRFQKRLNFLLVFFLVVFIIIVADKIHIILTG